MNTEYRQQVYTTEKELKTLGQLQLLLGATNVSWLFDRAGRDVWQDTPYDRVLLYYFYQVDKQNAKNLIVEARIEELIDLALEIEREGVDLGRQSRYVLGGLFGVHICNISGLTKPTMEAAIEEIIQRGYLHKVEIDQLAGAYNLAQFDQSNFFTA